MEIQISSPQVFVRKHILEFYDPEKQSSAKWFQIEDVDVVVQHENACGVLISRGNWREVRHCCYVIATNSDTEVMIPELCLFYLSHSVGVCSKCCAGHQFLF